MTRRRTELVLEDGTTFTGQGFGAARSVAGEVVFCTAMSGYVETLTDPSYRGQILVLTYPLVGNYGVPDARADGSLDAPYESSRVQVAGLVVAQAVSRHSHATARRSLATWLADEEIPGLEGIDTRALTRHLRAHGTMRGRLVVEGAEETGTELRMSEVAALVAPPQVTRHEAGPKRVLLVDAGAKDNLVRSLLAAGLSVVRAPFTADLAQLADDVDGIVLGSGPGDPKDLGALIATTRVFLAGTKPVFGVCLGNQIVGLAAGADTAKLPYGHRGVNQPVVDVTTRRAFVTSQNHGFAVVDASLPAGWAPWFVNANDGTNEGLRCEGRPHRSVQFHPEARPGPGDTTFLFEDYARLVHEAGLR